MFKIVALVLSLNGSVLDELDYAPGGKLATWNNKEACEAVLQTTAFKEIVAKAEANRSNGEEKVTFKPECQEIHVEQ